MNGYEQTLLLIEDDEHFRDSLSAYLEAAGYAVITAAGADEGLDQMTRLNPDLVLCNPGLTGESGRGVLELLRGDSPLKPIILLSTEEAVADVLEALRQGADDYLTKPIVDLKILEHAIERCLEQSKLRQQNLDYRRRLEYSNQELQESLEVLRQDQKAGRQVQFRMLPATPKQYGHYQFTHRIVPSLYLSGDFVDYFTVGERHVVFFIADVSGHGASSAFVTVLLKNLFARKRSEYRHSDNREILSPVKMLQRANRGLLHTGLGKHATLCVGVLDLRADTLCYSIAGHLPLPLIAYPGHCEYLAGTGMPIGLFDSAEYTEQTVALPEAAVLTLFSDGILEVLGVEGVLQQEQTLREKLSDGPRRIDDIVTALDLGHLESVPDDIAALLICRQP